MVKGCALPKEFSQRKETSCIFFKYSSFQQPICFLKTYFLLIPKINLEKLNGLITSM